MMTRRRFAQLAGMAGGSLLLREPSFPQAPPDIKIEIAPFLLEVSEKHSIHTVAYNGQVPGPLLRMTEGKAQTVEITNRSNEPEVVHWHGLYLPSDVDGAMEEGTPMIAPGATVRYSLTPRPAGFRWFHTHTFAGKNLSKAQYGGQHGFLMIDSKENPGRYDREFFLALHDWNGHFMSSDDGFMNPIYDQSTINGKMLGSAEPLRVKQGERVLFHILNSSPTEIHWVALAGHNFHVVALDGNTVPSPQSVSMLRLAPAERVSAFVEMNSPGKWILGEVRKHVQAAGMGIAIEYADAGGDPKWVQPTELNWNYLQFATRVPKYHDVDNPARPGDLESIELAFDSKFQGHGSEELWQINGKSYPNTGEPILRKGQRYRLVMKNLSMDDHPMHLHRHTFEVRKIEDSGEMQGLRKDVVLVPAKRTAEVEFVANNPGRTLFHCHQQDHMDRGFMMVFRYA